MCVCISLSAYVTLFCLFSPKVSIILLHPDKNVRKLTMNSATYKRPFKAVSSMASLDGRYNNIGGASTAQNPSGCQQNLGYSGPGTEANSGGLLSTTSNALNIGESSECKTCRCCCLGFTYTGCSPSARSWRSFSLTCCWLALRRWIAGCCAVGELGTTTAMELESTSDSP